MFTYKSCLVEFMFRLPLSLFSTVVQPNFPSVISMEFVSETNPLASLLIQWKLSTMVAHENPILFRC